MLHQESRPWPDFANRVMVWALVAQLDRASDFESEGREFESLRARQQPAVKTKQNDTRLARALFVLR